MMANMLNTTAAKALGNISGIVVKDFPNRYNGVAIKAPMARPSETLAAVTAITVALADGITSVIVGTLLTSAYSKVM
jgi:hypothetical protein